jgi:uncharacterized protein YcnI
MKKLFLATVAAGVFGLVTSASAHNTLTSMEGYAGYVTDFEMRVTHGCKGSPVKEVRIRVPKEVSRVSVAQNRDWKIETKMRKLDKPIQGEGGNTITEVVDEIIWKEPKSVIPAGGVFEGFKFRGALPKDEGKIIFFQTINVCEQGDDKYIDLPKEELKITDADFKKKLFAFLTATPGPSPFLITVKAPKPQYPWEPVEGAPQKADASAPQKAH